MPASVAGRKLPAGRCAGSARLQQHARQRRRGRRDHCRFAPRGDRARREAPAGSRHRAARRDRADRDRGAGPRPTRAEETRAGLRRPRHESRAYRGPRPRCQPQDRSAGRGTPEAWNASEKAPPTTRRPAAVPIGARLDVSARSVSRSRPSSESAATLTPVPRIHSPGPPVKPATGLTASRNAATRAALNPSAPPSAVPWRSHPNGSTIRPRGSRTSRVPL